MNSITTMLSGVLELADMALAFAILGGLVTILVLYIVDVSQTSQAIRRNYPVIGRLRYFFEHLGVFFRQYFFAMDREELPFNRAQRAWVARAAKNLATMPCHIKLVASRDGQKGKEKRCYARLVWRS